MIGVGCLVFGFVVSAAVDIGTATLLADGDNVVTQQFTVKQAIKLPEVKVSLQLAMTVSPEKIQVVNQTLLQLKTAHGRVFNVTGISQTPSNTGLINVRANLTTHLPINELIDITKLIKAQTKSGQHLTIVNTVPYFSDSLRQAVENKLALLLYAKAVHFLKQLNRLTSPTIYSMGAVHYVPLDIQTPKRFMLMANSVDVRGQAPNGMEKSLTRQAKVVYIATARKDLQHPHQPNTKDLIP